MQGIRFVVVDNRNSLSSSLSCLTEVSYGVIFIDVHFLSIFVGWCPLFDCWGNTSCVDVEVSLLFRHIAVAVSITWIALHSVYVLWSFGDPHFVFGEENGHFHFFKMDSFSWGV